MKHLLLAMMVTIVVTIAALLGCTPDSNIVNQPGRVDTLYIVQPDTVKPSFTITVDIMNWYNNCRVGKSYYIFADNDLVMFDTCQYIYTGVFPESTVIRVEYHNACTGNIRVDQVDSLVVTCNFGWVLQ